ncbi:MAG: CinA family nicotinamide mononucleotide deamidase-related protein, partial [Chloroflexota bacterium]
MPNNVSAELISIGTEILLGEITDTNSVFMARALRDLGINVFYMISVGDNQDRIAATIRQSLTRSDIVITCGGLGPTIDDMTRQSIADATDRDLVFKQNLLDQIAARFEKYNVKMSDNNKRQAYLPANAITVENPVGTAPAFIVETDDNKCVVSLPGVPREMKYLLTEKIIPYLRDKYDINEQIILARILKTAGIGESTLDTMIGTEILERSNPTVGLAAHSGQIDIRITAKADTRDAALALITPVEAEIRRRSGNYIFGADDDKLEVAFANLLRKNNATLAVSETGLGSVISDRLSPHLGDLIQGISTFVAPTDLAKTLAMPPSSLLTTLAAATAVTTRETSGSTICI